MIRYTKTTRLVLSFIQEFGFATIKIIANTIYKDRKNPKEQARVVLKKLTDNGDLVAYKMDNHGERIYQFKKEKVSDHKYYLINLYSEIFKVVNHIEYFKIEETWTLSNRRTDAHIIFTVADKYTKSYLIEFDKFHSTDKDKYIQIFETNEVQEWYKEKTGTTLFPDVIIIDSCGKTKVQTNGEFNVICLDYNFTNLIENIIV